MAPALRTQIQQLLHGQLAVAWRLLFILSAFILGSCQPAANLFQPSPPSSRILFIGNSLTFYNGGVDQQLAGLDTSIEVRRLATGGYTLKDHWNGGEALAAIRGAHWNYVVLQEQSQTPVTGQAVFLEYAAKFDTAIRSAGAGTVLFMTWEQPDSVQYRVTTHNLANAYYAAGSQLGAVVAPVGLAFARSLQEEPGLVLYVEDGHPTSAGTYLSACVLYATMFSKSPVGLTYAPSGMSAADRDFLQKIAAESVGY
jgi:hypothetical protein